MHCEDMKPACLDWLRTSGYSSEKFGQGCARDSVAGWGEIGEFRIPCLILNAIRLRIPGTKGCDHV